MKLSLPSSSMEVKVEVERGEEGVLEGSQLKLEVRSG